MIINGRSLWLKAPIDHMLPTKESFGGTTYGLGEAGYDIRIKQDIWFYPDPYLGTMTVEVPESRKRNHGRFALASAIEHFQMPCDLVAVVHDKSTWARRGLSVFNTVIEPGWKGFLTLELVYHGNKELKIPAGAGIAQVMFHKVAEPAQYKGRYQDQEDRPVGAKDA